MPTGDAAQRKASDAVTAVHPTRYFALACDYDGTIAHAGTVSESMLAARQERQNNSPGREAWVWKRNDDFLPIRGQRPRL